MWVKGQKSFGRLRNPGKLLFLQIAAKDVNTVGVERDTDGVTFVRKAMVRCGLALSLNGVWEEKQLFTELQRITQKYKANFDGDLAGTATGYGSRESQ